MKGRTIIVLVAVFCLAAGGGIGGYLISNQDSSKEPPVPKALQNPILDQATAQGIINGYRVEQGVSGQHPAYTADEGNINLSVSRKPQAGCVGNALCPQTVTRIDIKYRARAEDDARAILRIAQGLYGGRKGMLFIFTPVS